MFCPECGTELKGASKYCYNCGAKITLLKEDICSENHYIDNTTQGMIRKDPETVELSFYSFVIRFQKESLDNAKLIATLQQKAEILRADVLQSTISNSGNPNALYELYDVLENKLVELKKYTYDSIRELGYDFAMYDFSTECEWVYTRSYNTLKAQEIEIQNAKALAAEQREQMLSYNRARKASRGRFVGGGFGLEGAMKGMLTASSLNSATGAFYSVGNMFSNMSVNSNYRRQLKAINDAGLNAPFLEAFMEDCQTIIFDAARVLSISHPGFIFNQETRRKANVVYNQICELSSRDKNEIIELFLKILAIYPMESEYFVAVSDKIGDPNRELLNIAKALQVDTADIECSIAAYEFVHSLIGSFNDIIEEKRAKGELPLNRFWDYLTEEGKAKEEIGLAPLNFNQWFIELFSFDLQTGFRFKSFYCDQNKYFLSLFSDIDFTWQQPLGVFWLKSVPTNQKDCFKEKEYPYLLITSEMVYTSEYRIPVMDIFKMYFDAQKRVIVINDDIEIDGGILFLDKEVGPYFFTCILYLQLLHMQGESNAIIPLLEQKKNENLCADNIYNSIKTRILGFNGYIAEEIYDIHLKGNPNLYINGYCADSINEFLARRFDLDVAEELPILTCWNNSGCGFVITDKAFLYDDIREKEEKFKRIPLSEFKNSMLSQSLSPVGLRVFENEPIKVSGYREKDFGVLCIIQDLIRELVCGDVISPKNIRYDFREVDPEQIILETISANNPTEALSDIIQKMVSSHEIKITPGVLDVSTEGLALDEKDIFKAEPFALREDEEVLIWSGKPLFRKPQKSGWMVTDKAIKILEKGNCATFEWESILDHETDGDKNTFIIDSMKVISYDANLFKLVQQMQIIMKAYKGK